jgi:carbon-monoxide dehydrogenase small subunit
MRLSLRVNGEEHAVEAPAERRLADALRDDLGLLGTKVACGEGACGACAVLLDGRPVNSCLVLAAAAEGHEVTTIEGLSRDGLTPLQQAFVAEDALQCGFCTPGQVVSATALLAANPSPTPAEVRAGMAGNLCRCGCYVKIERAILRVAAEGA